MPDKKPDHWRNAVTREAERQFAFALKRIGNRLRFRHAKIVGEPLTQQMTVLLDELRRRRPWSRNQRYAAPRQPTLSSITTRTDQRLAPSLLAKQRIR